MSIRDIVTTIADEIRPEVERQLKVTDEATVNFSQAASALYTREDVEGYIDLIAKELNLVVVEKTDTGVRVREPTV